MAIYIQGIQDVVDTAVNIEFNRSKLVAQTISRSGRISTASRNWANPYRFTVTPKPVWEYAAARAMIETIYTNDRYQTASIYFGDYPKGQTIVNPVFTGYISGNVLTVSTFTSGQIRTGDIISGSGVAPDTQIEARISGFAAGSIWYVGRSQTVGSSGSPIAMTGNTTSLGNPDQDWISKYRGSQDTDNDNFIIDNYSSYTATGTTMIIQEQTGEAAPANDMIVRSNDFIRIANDLYPYQVVNSVPVPVKITGVTGASSLITPGDETSTITGLTSTTGLSIGQVLTRTAGTGTLGTNTYIRSIDSATAITVASTTACTAGTITFTGDGTVPLPATNPNHKVALRLNRGYLGAGQAANTALFVGGDAAVFRVKVTKLPTYRFINKDLFEFTGDFELVEAIL